MTDFAKQRILVTGGSSGIGLALAMQAVQRGAHVLIAGRRRAAIDDAVASLRQKGGADRVHGVVGDVAAADGRAAIVQAAQEQLGGLDILVNNAGAVRAGRLENVSDEEIETMVATNLLGPIFLTRALLPQLRECGDAVIVNVSSSIGVVAMPFYAVYAGVKAGITRFGDAMRRELMGEGVRVLNVYPTATDTPMMKTGNRSVPLDSAEAVAAAIVEGIESGAREVIRGGDARAQMIALEHSDPAALDERIAAQRATLEAAVMHHSAL